MEFLIMGYRIGYGSRKTAEVYGRFDNRKELYTYLDWLKRSSLSDTVKFFVKEKHDYED